MVGGLRGALALALALALPSSLPPRDEIVIASFAVVVFSPLVQGLTTTPLMRWLGLLPRLDHACPRGAPSKHGYRDFGPARFLRKIAQIIRTNAASRKR